MDLGITLACAGAGISLFGFIQYLNGIMHHGTQPRIASWAAWLTANTIFTAVAFQEQAWLAVAINGVGIATNLLVIITSGIKKVSMKPSDLLDWACLVISVICVGCVVYLPDMPVLTAMLAMVANLIATIPTFRHAWSKPHEETWQLFAANAFANGLGIISIAVSSGVEMVALAGPLVSTLGNATLVMITAARKWMVAVEEEVVTDIQILEQRLAASESEVE